jgi:hypothetical protein
MKKSLFGVVLLVACTLAFAQAGSSALDKVKAQDNQTFKAGTDIDFYCLIVSVDHPRAGVGFTCVRRTGGNYLMAWGDKFGPYEAFANVASRFAPKEIVHARCTVMYVWTAKNESEDQISLACAPPIRAQQ